MKKTALIALGIVVAVILLLLVGNAAINWLFGTSSPKVSGVAEPTVDVKVPGTSTPVKMSPEQAREYTQKLREATAATAELEQAQEDAAAGHDPNMLDHTLRYVVGTIERVGEKSEARERQALIDLHGEAIVREIEKTLPYPNAAARAAAVQSEGAAYLDGLIGDAVDHQRAELAFENAELRQKTAELQRKTRRLQGRGRSVPSVPWPTKCQQAKPQATSYSDADIYPHNLGMKPQEYEQSAGNHQITVRNSPRVVRIFADIRSGKGKSRAYANSSVANPFATDTVEGFGFDWDYYRRTGECRLAGMLIDNSGKETEFWVNLKKVP